MTTAPKPFPAKYGTGKCAVCSRPIEKGMLVLFKQFGNRRRLICGSGECVKTAPERYCSACGQGLPT